MSILRILSRRRLTSSALPRRIIAFNRRSIPMFALIARPRLGESLTSLAMLIGWMAGTGGAALFDPMPAEPKAGSCGVKESFGFTVWSSVRMPTTSLMSAYFSGTTENTSSAPSPAAGPIIAAVWADGACGTGPPGALATDILNVVGERVATTRRTGARRVQRDRKASALLAYFQVMPESFDGRKPGEVWRAASLREGEDRVGVIIGGRRSALAAADQTSAPLHRRNRRRHRPGHLGETPR